MERSLILPIYKAEGFLRKVLETLDADLSREAGLWELILVIDASPDRSEQICRDFAARTKKYPIKIFVNEANLGKGATTKRGMLAATGKYRIFTDCDLAYPMSEVRKVLAALENGADVAIASRVHDESQYTIYLRDFHYLYTRHIASRFFNWVVRGLLVPHCRDTQAGLKGFRAEAAQFLFSQQHLSGFSFDLELLFLAQKAHLSLQEVPIHFQYREELSTVDFVTDAFELMRDIFLVRRRWKQELYTLSSSPAPRRRLIIHADDFGLADGINEGIVAGHKAGSITSMSLLVNFPASEKGLALARQHSLDVGWHLNLTLGQPVAPPELLPTLVGPDGQFYPLPQFLKRLFMGEVHRGDIEREIEAQWEKFEKAGVRPTHLDGHQHVQMLPIVREVTRTLVQKHGIPFIRISNEDGGITLPRPLARFFLRSLRSSRSQFWKESGARSVSFYGLSLGKEAGNLAAWKKLLKRINESVGEVMVHPGFIRPQEDLSGDDFPGNREAEWALLTSPEWRNLVNEMGFQLVSFRDLLQ